MQPQDGWLTQDVQEVQASIAASIAYEEEERSRREAHPRHRTVSPQSMEDDPPSSRSGTERASGEFLEEPPERRPSFMLSPLSEKLTEPVIAMMRSLMAQKELSEDERQLELPMFEKFIERAQEEYQFSRMFSLYEEAVRALSEQPGTPSSALDAEMPEPPGASSSMPGAEMPEQPETPTSELKAEVSKLSLDGGSSGDCLGGSDT